MGRRLSGLLLILHALAPVLIVLILGGALAIVLNDVRAAVDGPLQSIGSEIQDVRDTVDSARDDITAVGQDVSALVSTLSSFSVPNLIPNIPANLSFPSLRIPSVNIPIPDVSVRTTTTNIAGVNITYPSGLSVGSKNYSLSIPDIPSFSIPLPGLSEVDDALRSALSGITGVFDSFHTAFGSIGDLVDTLQLVPDHMTRISDNAELLMQGLLRVIARWSETILIVTIILLVLVVIYYGVPVLDELTRGWRRLRGLPDGE